MHDFVTDLGRANPYGVYDLAANCAWVSVGTDHDTASFAVATIRRWWQQMGQARHPAASELTITADCGGSNGYRTRLWKVELQDLADELQIPITVCHLPPGTSKWNRIEHRLFSHITMNWRGKPLISHEVIVSLIAATTTRSGLTVQAALDTDPSQGHQDHRRAHANARDHPTRLPRRLELHAQTPARHQHRGHRSLTSPNETGIANSALRGYRDKPTMRRPCDGSRSWPRQAEGGERMYALGQAWIGS